MAKSDLLKEAIADARAVKETALANAKIALQEAFQPRFEAMLQKEIEGEMGEEEEVADAEMDMDMDMMHQMDEMGMDMNMMDMDMAMMDGEALVAEFEKSENKDLGFIDLVVPHHMMAVHQSWVGLQLAEHEELKDLCQDVIDAQTTEIKELLEIRKEIS